VAAIETMVADNYVRHDANGPEVRGIDGEKQLFIMLLVAFPDLHITTEELIAEGETVMARLSIRGRHQGEFMGIPPTNMALSFAGVDTFRILVPRLL
jgi:predicted ester cyclase